MNMKSESEQNQEAASAVGSTGSVALSREEVSELRETLWAARRDIWQTARVSEYNLTGVDPCFPSDPPQIPETPQLIHREGIDQSYRVIQRLESVLRMLAAKRTAKASTGNRPSQPQEPLNERQS